MPELDSLRGVAVLLVLFHHGYFWSGVKGLGTGTKAFVELTRWGWLGVNLFFVLSGFLITGILVDSRCKEGYFRQFYTRRALRILPAYYGFLLVLLVTGLKPLSFLVLSFFYLSNVTPLFGVVQSYPVLWSLAVEEHFYLLWPMIVRRFSIRRVEQIAIAVVCIVPALRWASYMLAWRTGLSEYTWLVCDGLAMGAWLAIRIRKPELTRELLARISMGALTVALVATFACARLGIFSRQRPLGAAFQQSCGNLAFLGLIGLALLVGTGRWKTLIHWPLLKFYGDISYGLYLIHLFVFGQYDRLVRHFWPQVWPWTGGFAMGTLRFLICAALATGLALLSRRYFEEPFLRMKTRFGASVPPTDSPSPVLSKPSGQES
jgi:peptidoglycan/LPS O-acetylase OafA/YrhL